MRKIYIVYQGISYPFFSRTENGIYLYTSDVKSIQYGFAPFEDRFRKFITDEEVDQRYSVEDKVIYKNREFDIIGSSNDNYLEPDSWVRIVTEDIDFLKAHNIWKDELIYDNQYGRQFFASDALPMEEVTILRSREILPRR